MTLHRRIGLRTAVQFGFAALIVSCGSQPAPARYESAESVKPAPAQVSTSAYDPATEPLGDPVTLEGARYWREDRAHRKLEAVVAWVSDGDTFRTDSGLTIRMLGINCPEIAHPEHGKPVGDPYGEAAKRFMVERIAKKKVTLVIPTEVEKDKYGRTLALVLDESGTVLNVELVRYGLARAFVLDNDYLLFYDSWQLLMRKAKEARIGMWSVETRKPLEL